MKKVFAIVALVAAMFVAGNVQAQNMVYVGYAPETFTYTNSSTNYQGFCVGFSKNVGIAKGFGVAAGAQFRMNMRSNTELNGGLKTKETQTMIDVPVLFNYGIAINRDLVITPFVGPWCRSLLRATPIPGHIWAIPSLPTLTPTGTARTPVSTASTSMVCSVQT